MFHHPHRPALRRRTRPRSGRVRHRTAHRRGYADPRRPLDEDRGPDHPNEDPSDHSEEEFPDITVLPIVHGDTHAGVFPQAWAFATDRFVAHNEAELRGMMPPFESTADPAAFAVDRFEGDWTLTRAEPFPEQYDTFVGSAASIHHGENVGERIVEFLDARRNDKAFEWASARAGFDTADRGFDYL